MGGAGEFVIVLYLVESFAFVSALFGLCLPNGGQLSRPEMKWGARIKFNFHGNKYL